jgi:hypothetical protein
MSTINVDNINEHTSAGGVTIDGAVIKDGKVTGGAAGLTLITSGSVSTVTGITLDNVFTSTFPNYLFQFNGQGDTNNIEELRLRFRAGGSTNSDSDSSFAAMICYKTSGQSSADSYETDIDQSYFQLVGNWIDNEKFSGQVTIHEPQVSGQSTGIQYQFGTRYNQSAESYATFNGTGQKGGTSSFDGLYFYADDDQTITGNYRLYGLN